MTDSESYQLGLIQAGLSKLLCLDLQLDTRHPLGQSA